MSPCFNAALTLSQWKVERHRNHTNHVNERAMQADVTFFLVEHQRIPNHWSVGREKGPPRRDTAPPTHPRTDHTMGGVHMNPWASKSQAESGFLVHPGVADAEHVGHCRVLARAVVVAARRSRWGPAHAELPENGTRPTAARP